MNSTELGRELHKTEVLAPTTPTPTTIKLSTPEATNLDTIPIPDLTNLLASSTKPNPTLLPTQLALPLHPLVEAGMLLLLPPLPAPPFHTTSLPIDNSDL